MSGLAPRARQKTLRPRRLSDASWRPLNFTVRPRVVPLLRLAPSCSSTQPPLSFPLTSCAITCCLQLTRSDATRARSSDRSATRPSNGRCSNATCARVLSNEAQPSGVSEHGQKFTVRGALSGPNGRSAGIVSIWIILVGETAPRFVTAYPEE